MIVRRKFALLALLCLAAAACGLKGPLYRPDDTKQEEVAPASAPSGAVKKKDGASGNPPGKPSEPSVSPPDPDRPSVPPPER